MSALFYPEDIKTLYASFDSPIAAIDCGRKCSPYNERGIPFCCDTLHAVPTAYQAEWCYLEENTDLWHRWENDDQKITSVLRGDLPAGMEMIECLGHVHCQRNYRSVTCRAFPFYPYIDGENCFLGLTCYWEYEDRCWVISNLDAVTREYRGQFIDAYDVLLEEVPDELKNFGYHSHLMRQIFAADERLIPLLHRDGKTYHINPRDEQSYLIDLGQLPKFGPYEIAAMMPFSDEQ